jgi:hypothetical protein
VYFSVADGQLENFLDKDAFDRSLLLNAFFQPGILIPDIFCFISHGLEQHIIKRPRQSLFEACVANGIVIPAFRDRACSSFQEALHLCRELGIQGIRESSDRIAHRLQLAWKSSRDIAPAYWPQHDVGDKFDQIITRCLACPEPPQADAESGISQQQLSRLWKLTERWRLDCLEEARVKTRKTAGIGLRRGEIMNAVGRDLGLPVDHMVNNIAELFALPLESPEKEGALRVFFRWVCECYQYTQAVEFETIPSFPGYDPLAGVVVCSVFPMGPPLLDWPHVPTIRETVRFPPMNVLQTISANDLLQARNELSPAYFTALMAWQRQPIEANAKEVHSTLQQYSKEILRWSAKKRDFGNAFLDVVAGAGTTPTRRLLRAILDLGVASGAMHVPFLTPLVALGRLGYAIYAWRSQPAEDSLIEIEATESVAKIPPEVNFPETSGSFDSSGKRMVDQ